ncbi:uncharacterized protein LOC121371321 [Gigantopelta aegis]|uniref:uncharacterized protein LOC121371321 n=1 Tax=Gigantopelta aegis TaxID=1735272 RepID=UPI001B88A671|nr:uncharacterized protein LOC121371321 [Gigantopelta aegis]
MGIAMKCLIVLTVGILHLVQGQICLFYLYTADCRYRVDGVAMGHIVATIDDCNSPADVTFKITCEEPPVSWSHTYSNDNEIVDVKGFDVLVRLNVRLSRKEKKKLWVKAVFFVEGQGATSFIDEHVHLTNINNCLALNSVEKTSIALVAILFVIMTVLISSLVYMRFRVKRRRHNGLVDSMEVDLVSENLPSLTPPSSPNSVLGGWVYTMGFKRVHYLPTITEQSETQSTSADMSNLAQSEETNAGFTGTNHLVSHINGRVVSADAAAAAQEISIISGQENTITQTANQCGGYVGDNSTCHVT